MSQLVADCPRCGAKNIALSALAAWNYDKDGQPYLWDVFAACSHCFKTSVLIVCSKAKGPLELSPLRCVSINEFYEVASYQSLKDQVAQQPPEHLPAAIKAAFEEGATCVAVGCYNAAATMFRMCLDIATKELLPAVKPPGLTHHIQKNLGPRMGWLFDNGILPPALRPLAECVKDDGNDGAHDGTLGKPDAEDLMDFTSILLERLYTEPKRLELAAERRTLRHSAPTS